MKSITLRPYQIQCKEAIRSNYKKGVTEQLIIEATGLGKRLQAINLIQHFKRTLFIAHREELIIQAYDDITRFYPMQCGIIKAQRFEVDRKIVVASVQTLTNRLDKIDPSTFDLIIVDEVHHYRAKSYLKVIRHFKPKLLTGWTATPKRMDGLNLSNIFQAIVFNYDIGEGIKHGFLANIDAYQVKTTIDLSKVKKVAGDFNKRELSEQVDCPDRNALIVDRYEKYCKGEQAIGFCVDINHAYNLRDSFIAGGYVSETVVSDTERCPDRKDILARFARGEIDVLTNVNILTEGYDYSDVGCVLMARPTQSETFYIQAIGRGTRLKSEPFQERFGHAKCIVLDFVDNTSKHQLVVNAYTLEADKPIESKLFISDSERDLLIETRERRIATIEANREVDARVDLLQLPTLITWQSKKMEDPASEKQLEWIKNLGVFEEGELWPLR